MSFLTFLASLAEPLYAAFEHFTSGAPPDPEKEKQLAMSIVRKASDERAKRDIEGA